MIVNSTTVRVQEIGPADRAHTEKGNTDQGFYTMLASMMSGKASQRTGVQTAMAQRTGTDTGKRTARRKETDEGRTAEAEAGGEGFREKFDAYAALLQGQTGGAELLPQSDVPSGQTEDGSVLILPGTAGIPAVLAGGTGKAAMQPAPMETAEAFLGQTDRTKNSEPGAHADLVSSQAERLRQAPSETDSQAGNVHSIQESFAEVPIQTQTTAMQIPDLMRIVTENRSYSGPVTAPEMQLQYLTVGAEQETAIPGTGFMTERVPGREAAMNTVPVPTDRMQSITAEAAFVTVPQKTDLPASGDIPVSVMLMQDSDAVKAKSSFDQAVYEAQKTMRGDFKPRSLPGDEEEQTIPALQNLTGGTVEIRSRETEQITAPVQEAEEAGDMEVLKQVTTGIARGLEEGEKEFVIRLKPEGLGEITVLMAQKSGRLVLNIVASSAQTEKLISGEAAGLRESLRTYNAELQQVTNTETNPDAYSYLAGQDAQTGSEQRFDQWQYAEQQRQAGVGYASDDTADPAIQRAAERKIPQLSALLNKYI